MSKEVIPLIADDPWLAPYQDDIAQRMSYFEQRLNDIKSISGSLSNFAEGHHYFGFNYDKKAKGWWYREWAPAADSLCLIGEFNNWHAEHHPMTQDENGVWGVFIADESEFPLKAPSQVKVKVQNGLADRDRLPAYIQSAIQDPKSYDFSGEVIAPSKYKWKDAKFKLEVKNPIIYECHVGMAQEKEGVGTFREFADSILPRVAKQGYNCIQVMAIQEHPYYGSFGYHVSNFYAPSSRFGTPDDLRYLVDQAHQMGIAVIMDAVYSHAVKNIAEGLNDFDGSDNQYFHKGGRGYHTGWDSKLFDYGRTEVLQFLLSNIRYWMEEFHMDGFRFDGVTSMLYHHHGEGVAFDHYDKYFKEGVDWDAICFLQLANELIHEIKPNAISIAEDMSGMPGMCRPVSDGGLGFDYRLGMGLPDYWIKLLKHSADENWSMNELWNVMANRRYKEKTIAYAESHDQALVGDKSLAFWLMDKEMYWHMTKDDKDLVVERGIALHKMIRLITASLGGEGYLNFIGNEFGHPEWVDFPREGNDWSYKYARRQWSLVDNTDLKYEWLNDFDRAMLELLAANNILSAQSANQLNMDEENKVMIYERNHLIFVFNFHPDRSIADYKFHVPEKGEYKVILSSDDLVFGGHDRIDTSVSYPSTTYEHGDQLSVYTPSRTAMVLKKL
ncbi:MAG: alpha amylase C-terminal domain-containing protein [Reichenbachiella sp.]|uniref:alpha amylase C-terminal domain-containing protein n=1 Tax=Reichenbachiella sp. TaxID=2184521 RepID=UPI0029670AA6|nr:alpha amylase C-terminal domain-containing protein [Reichenbachiella sp.]MDW3211933.1 alpha amylase C-terminal domain-containing protein [Reichenbachiella sp.]